MKYTEEQITIKRAIAWITEDEKVNKTDEGQDLLNSLEELVKLFAMLSARNRRELFDKFYAWLDGLTQEEYDAMSLTDKCENFFFKA